MGRSPCCDKVRLKKGPWTPEEDQKLSVYIEQHGRGSWRSLPLKAGLQRCGKSCRLRWTNYLRPDIKRGKFSLQEEQTIIQLHALLENRWSSIATHLPKRTDNEIKNYWNTHLKKRLIKMGIDPVTHKPKSDALISNNNMEGNSSKGAANLSHMAQWESARLEAETRLARESRLRISNPLHHQQLLLHTSSSPDPMKQNNAADPNHQLPNNTGLCFRGSRQHHHSALDLESPTSTLTFPGANQPVSASGSGCSEYFLESSGNEGTDKVAVKETWTPESTENDAHGRLENEDHGYVMNSDAADAGFTGLLLSNNTSKVSGLEENEDNKSYWKNILDLVNTSPSDDSPMF